MGRDEDRPVFSARLYLAADERLCVLGLAVCWLRQLGGFKDIVTVGGLLGRSLRHCRSGNARGVAVQGAEMARFQPLWRRVEEEIGRAHV